MVQFASCVRLAFEFPIIGFTATVDFWFTSELINRSKGLNIKNLINIQQTDISMRTKTVSVEKQTAKEKGRNRKC